MKSNIAVALVLFVFASGPSRADDSPVTSQRLFRRMFVGTLGLPDEEFLRFVERVRPEIVVIGAFGAPQWAAQDDARQWMTKWRAVFARMHRGNVKVIGMIELLNVGNSPKDAERFLDFYANRWDERLLGAKPKVSGESLLERRAMPAEKQVGAHAPRGCAVNPNWRAVEKAFVKALVDAGIDGFITHRNMFGECRCDHCSRGFRRWLADRYDREQVKSQFGIRDLKTHRFEAIYGHHRDHKRPPTPIQLEGMKFARHAIKECFDDVFVKFGRSFKKNLIVAQWNHMPYFDELHLDRGHIPPWHLTTFAHASADERWSLPIDLSGRDEDFYWYCNWGTCQNTQLDKRFLADVTLYAKLLRSLARGKSYVVNKYDFYRPRNMMAEAAALGMVAGAIAVPYRTAEDAKTMAHYFNFLKQHRRLYENNNGQPASNVLLVYPRSQTHAGDASGLEMIEVAGRSMIVDHVQFDFVPDDLLDGVDFDKYRAIVASSPVGLDARRLVSFFQSGGSIIAVPRDKKRAGASKWRDLGAHVVSGLTPHSGGTKEAAPFLRALRRTIGNSSIRIGAPYTVEAHVYRQPDRLVVHLVNYNHQEKAPGRSVVEREAPIASKSIRVELPLTVKVKVRRVTFLDPDAEKPRDLDFEQGANLVRFQTPSFLVYGVCVIELGK